MPSVPKTASKKNRMHALLSPQIIKTTLNCIIAELEINFVVLCKKSPKMWFSLKDL
jgi:hypothetical protein